MIKNFLVSAMPQLRDQIEEAEDVDNLLEMVPQLSIAQIIRHPAVVDLEFGNDSAHEVATIILPFTSCNTQVIPIVTHGTLVVIISLNFGYYDDSSFNLGEDENSGLQIESQLKNWLKKKQMSLAPASIVSKVCLDCPQNLVVLPGDIAVAKNADSSTTLITINLNRFQISSGISLEENKKSKAIPYSPFK